MPTNEMTFFTFLLGALSSYSNQGSMSPCHSRLKIVFNTSDLTSIILKKVVIDFLGPRMPFGPVQDVGGAEGLFMEI